MTSQELYNKLKPNREQKLVAQLLEGGLNVNIVDFYTKLIKDAARCNSYSSDVVFNINYISRQLREFNKDTVFEPIWVGFRRHGVDSTTYILSRIDEDGNTIELYKNYFALYSINVVEDPEYPDFRTIVIGEYWS